MRHVFTRWPFFWILQLLLSGLIALAAALLPLLFPQAYVLLRTLFLWILPPIAGALTAGRLARLGLNPYLAWPVPPLAHWGVYLAALGFSPAMGSTLLCAFVSLVGAATGDVMRRRAMDD